MRGLEEYKYFAAIESSGLSPEEFGELLATATNPVNLDDARSRALRASCRGRIITLPYGREILSDNESELE